MNQVLMKRGRWSWRGGRRGFATLLVFGVIVVAAVIIGMIQSTAFSQAAAGRESLARVRAYWAARAGLEETIAKLEAATEDPNQTNAFQAMDDMVQVATGTVAGASWRIASTDGKREVLGPTDAHSKININSPNSEVLLNIEPFMSESAVDSIKDWIDSDDDLNLQGAEVGYYQTLEFGYDPRNAPMCSIAELELVADIEQTDVRGEDWNLNGVLDPNEDDGDLSWPPDNADGVLDQAWSGILTASSVDGGLAASGEKPLDLKTAAEGDLTSRIGVSSDQAKVIVDYVASSDTAALGDFIRRDLQQLRTQTQQAQGQQQGGAQTRVDPLTTDQLKLLIDECVMGAPEAGVVYPGKLNVNTCAAETIEYLPGMTPELADAIIAERAGKSDGFTSIVDLLEVPGMTRRQLAQLNDLLCVRSNVFTVTSRGRDDKTGLEVEIQAELNRTSLPVTLTGVLVR
jgi:type II secretory pathway component PulK